MTDNLTQIVAELQELYAKATPVARFKVSAALLNRPMTFYNRKEVTNG